MSVANHLQWHLITSEYPPQPGGVSDYTQLVAKSLAAAGDEVHVWCPAVDAEIQEETGVRVHRELGRLSPQDLRHAGRLLNRFDGPRRVLVQWVPHGYGYRSMNLPFCLWLWGRAARRGDLAEVMIHEPYLPFGGSLRQSGVAAIHRLMTVVLLRAARRVWMSIPAWEARLRPYTMGRHLPFVWLPVASAIPVVDDAQRVKALKSLYAPKGERVVGHFGTYGKQISRMLLDAVPSLLGSSEQIVLLLLGRGSETMRARLINLDAGVEPRVFAFDDLSAVELSLRLSVCDVMLQPYPDGISSRRTSAMACLAHGLPLVTTKGALTESLWMESGAVRLVAPDDTTALISLTQSLLADAGARACVGAKARELYQSRFDLRHTINALREAAA